MRFLLDLLWVILAVLAAWGLAVGLLLATPQELAVLLGFAVFMLLASRLLWGYGALSVFAEGVGRGEQPDRGQAEAAARVPEPERLGFAALASFWLAALEPYRYAFYAVYLVLMLVTLASKLVLPLPDLWAWVTGSTLFEGVFWGASVVALLVWSISSLAASLTAKAASSA